MEGDMPTYFDHAATTPVDPRVAEVTRHYMLEEFGNAGSRTHVFGARAQQAAERAREQVAAVVAADPAEVVFTSGATEADNLTLLGLAEHGRAAGRMHIVATAVEHKAVLEPLDVLAKSGFDIDLVRPGPSGAVPVDAVLDLLRDDTLLVSVMLVNNETGIRQPVGEIAERLGDSPTFLHTDAAQAFGKELDVLRHPRIDMISVSGHKVYAPKGVGALVTRRRNRRRPPLTPLMYGGGQERGLRPGTLPVALVVGFGMASELAAKEAAERRGRCLAVRRALWDALVPLHPVVNGDPDLAVPHILNVSLPGVDSEAAILALRPVLAVSNGSACTSAKYEPSHVLTAMGLDEEQIRGAIRFSWGHDTSAPDGERITEALHGLL